MLEHRQTYVEFDSLQAATAAKHLISQMPSDSGNMGKKISAAYWNTSMNPFRTLPKDAPARGAKEPGRTTSGSYNDRGGYNNNNGGYRGGRGGFNANRGGNMGQNNFQRNNYNNNVGGMGGMGYNGGGYNNGMQGQFGFNPRGNMMGGGMRGGGMRGGRGGPMMGMNMGMPMGMPGNMPAMGMMGPGGMPGTSLPSHPLTKPLAYPVPMYSLPRNGSKLWRRWWLRWLRSQSRRRRRRRLGKPSRSEAPTP